MSVVENPDVTSRDGTVLFSVTVKSDEAPIPRKIPSLAFSPGAFSDHNAAIAFAEAVVAAGIIRRAVIWDPRGFGQSDYPISVAAHAPERYVEDFEAIVSTLLADDDTIAAGHSKGGIIANNYALTDPEQVVGVALLSATGTMPKANLDIIQASLDATKDTEGFAEFLRRSRFPVDSWNSEYFKLFLRSTQRQLKAALNWARVMEVPKIPTYRAIGDLDPVYSEVLDDHQRSKKQLGEAVDTEGQVVLVSIPKGNHGSPLSPKNFGIIIPPFAAWAGRLRTSNSS